MRKNRIWILLAGVVLLLLGVGIWQGVRGIRQLNLEAADRQALVIPVERLRAYGVTAGCGRRCTRFDSLHHGSGLEVSYEYDDRNGPDGTLYISSTALVGLNGAAAWENYWTYLAGFRLGMLGRDGGLELQEVSPNPMTLGEKRYWARLRNRHGIIGDMLVIRQGRTVLAYVIIGRHFEDQADLEDLLRPAVNRAVALEQETSA